MKIMIKYRLFLALLAATATVVVCMYLIMQWSIGRGFLTYINRMEKERTEKLAVLLEQNFARQGSWLPLQKDEADWAQMLVQTLPGRDSNDAEPAERQTVPLPAPPPPPHFPPRQGHRFESRVLLLDADRHRVLGAELPPEQIDLKPLLYRGKKIGYLGIVPRKRVTDVRQLRFLKEQKLAMGLVATIMLLVSAALSLPLSNKLVRPIRLLASSMHTLASGRFETRVAIDSADELGQLGKDFNALALSLEKNEEARRQWVADISHELRTPLSVLRGEVEAIQDGVRKPDENSMRSLHVEVMHLSRLVDDLYQLSLFDVGALTYRKEDLDLARTVRHALDSFRGEFEQKGISLVAKLPATGFKVFADEQRLLQLFDNLLDNSLKYTDPGGILEVQLQRRERTAVIDFRDSAPGVAEGELEKLFDRLFRVENSRNRALGGAGLGLAICKNIVEAHEGRVEARHAPQGGVWIRILLPLAGAKV